MATSLDELLAWLVAPETNFEFKAARGGDPHLDTMAKYCVALANEGGGKIVLGVTDKRPREIVGTPAYPSPERTAAGLHQRLHRRVSIEEVSTPAGRVVVIHVPGRAPGNPWHLDGQYLKRAGDEQAPLSEDELRAIFAETGPDFSAQVCPDATLGDLDPAAIAAFRNRWAAKEADDRRLSWTAEQTLSNAELLVDGGITYAALILFGTYAALGRHLAQAELVFEYRSSDASGPAADRREFREGFFLWHDAVWERINLRNDKQSYQDGLFRNELWTFDEGSVREALLNAVSHRDYRLGGSIFVRQYPQRLEVVSPGGFPPGVTVENLLEAQNPRNRRLATALQRCGFVERSGQGMNLLFESAIRQGKALPDFAGTSEHEVRLTLRGTVTTPEFVRFLERLGAEQVRWFSTDDLLALDHLRRDVQLSAALKARLPGLVQAGAVEAVGRGRGTRHILARSLYVALGGKGIYTRKKGLDRGASKALLLQHIKENAETGSQMKEFLEVLPAAGGRDAIASLLKDLRKDGLIRLVGTRKFSRWYPVH